MELLAWLNATAQSGPKVGSEATGTAFRILLETATAEEHLELVEKGLRHRFGTVREESIDAVVGGKLRKLYLAVARLLTDEPPDGQGHSGGSDYVQRAARNALLELKTSDDAVGAIVVSTISRPHVSVPPTNKVQVTLMARVARRIGRIVDSLEDLSRDEQTQKLGYLDRARIYALESVMWPNKIKGLGEALVGVLEQSESLSEARLSTICALASIAMEYVCDKEQTAQAVIERIIPLQRGATWGLHALGHLGIPAGIPTLEKFLEQGDLWQKRAAVLSLGRMTDPSAGPAIDRAWQDIRKVAQQGAAV